MQFPAILGTNCSFDCWFWVGALMSENCLRIFIGMILIFFFCISQFPSRFVECFVARLPLAKNQLKTRFTRFQFLCTTRI